MEKGIGWLGGGVCQKRREGGLSTKCVHPFFPLVVFLQIVKISPFSARKSNSTSVPDIVLANIYKVH